MAFQLLEKIGWLSYFKSWKKYLSETMIVRLPSCLDICCICLTESQSENWTLLYTPKLWIWRVYHLHKSVHMHASLYYLAHNSTQSVLLLLQYFTYDLFLFCFCFIITITVFHFSYVWSKSLLSFIVFITYSS